jgi:hypothetical protein
MGARSWAALANVAAGLCYDRLRLLLIVSLVVLYHLTQMTHSRMAHGNDSFGRHTKLHSDRTNTQLNDRAQFHPLNLQDASW